MSQIKTKEQIVKVKKACKETDVIFTSVLKFIKKNYSSPKHCLGLTEVELRDFILGEIKKRGLKPSFPPIVTSGKRAGNEIHPEPTDKKLQGFVIIDFGVVYQKYMSDMTRTIYVIDSERSRRMGSPTQKEKDIYTQTLLSQKMSIMQVRSGARCADADVAARESLGALSKHFIHMLGHGVGTRIHENPKIYHKLTKPSFKEGMIITIEPGLYIKNKFGMRIEDTCVVTKKGVQVLTKSTKKLLTF